MTATYLVGDVFDRMAELPDGSVDLVVTSPPFLALRSYLPDGHPDKAKEVGREAAPAEFIDTLLALTAEWRRLLSPHGSICVELGDTYAGSGGAGGDYADGGLRDGQARFDGSAARTRADGNGKVFRGGVRGEDKRGSGWPMEKSLTGIPDAYALSLEYGYNVLDRHGPDSPAGRWRVRNKVAWVRPNPPVGALADKFRPATSYLTVATIARDRYFDLDAVRGAPSPNTHARTAKGVSQLERSGKSADRGGNWSSLPELAETAGAPPLDWWEIPPGGYSGAHYAVYPPELCEKPIEAMCPRRVCTTCGQPSRRTQDLNPDYTGRAGGPTHANERQGASLQGFSHVAYPPTKWVPSGWSDCGHDSWRPGLVLDPFAGSATTLLVAHGHGRDSIGIDLDARNAELARERLGMFLEVDVPAVEGVG